MAVPTPGHRSWDEVPALLAEVDEDGRVLSWNQAAIRRLLPPENDGTPDGSWGFLIPMELERLRLIHFLSDNLSGRLQVTAGSEHWEIEAEAAPSPRLIALRDVSNEAADSDELADRCRLLEQRLALGRQDLQLIAFEIHDGLVQEMTAAQMFIETGLSQLPTEWSKLKSLQDAAFWLRRSIEGARRLINGLRPPELESGGLSDAVAQLIASRPDEQCKITLDANDPLDDLDPTVALSLFRIVQESLNNAWKHSNSARVHVTLVRQGGEVSVQIRDWGEGFDVEEAMGRRFGLKGMTQRAATFGGMAEIQSKPGKGTVVNVRLPLLCK